MVALDVVRLDLDRKFTRCGWVKQCQRIASVWALYRDWPGELVRVEVRETWHGFHVELHLGVEFPSAAHLVAIQAAMGSDGLREAMMLSRANAGRADDWNRLFQKKQGGPWVKPRLDYAGHLLRALRDVGERPTT